MQKAVGFIGTGRMGRPMAQRVISAGFPVHALARTEEAGRILADLGAQPERSSLDLAKKCQVVITMLPGPPEVEAVALGEGGVAAGIQPGAVLVDMSTSSPSLSRKIAVEMERRRAHFLDSPVSGGVEGAEKGQLTLMVGGKAEVLEMCRDVLAPMAGIIFHLGDVGAGHTAKLLNQLLVVTQSVLSVEVLATAARCGIDLATLHDLVSRSTGSSWCWERRVPGLLGVNTKKAAFDTWVKDLTLGTSLGREAGVPLFVSGAAFHVLQTARARSIGREDGMGALAEAYEEMLGVQIRRSRSQLKPDQGNLSA